MRRETSADDLRRQADALNGLVDAVQVNESPYSWVQMSALAACAILGERGVDTVPILTCRDRDRTALESELRGLHALGIDSLILLRGPRIPKKHAVPAATVFDLTGRQLIALAREVAAESSNGGAGDWYIGAAAQVFRPKPGWRAESLLARAADGARFAQTQLCLNLAMLRDYMTAYTAAGLHRKLPLVVSMTALPSATTGRWIRKTLTGSRVPEALIGRLELAADPVQEGVRICAEQMQEVAALPGVSGINLLTTGDPEAIAAAIQASGLRD
jgi:methylenetetrahydrofolate reductase (NADPH)